jgi:hypothetical protein
MNSIFKIKGTVGEIGYLLGQIYSNKEWTGTILSEEAEITVKVEEKDSSEIHRIIDLIGKRISIEEDTVIESSKDDRIAYLVGQIEGLDMKDLKTVLALTKGVCENAQATDKELNIRLLQDAVGEIEKDIESKEDTLMSEILIRRVLRAMSSPEPGESLQENWIKRMDKALKVPAVRRFWFLFLEEAYRDD